MDVLHPDSQRPRQSSEPGWYPDPDNPEALRHWHGTGWSESLFDDITSVAVVDSSDPNLLLEDVEQPALVALPTTLHATDDPAAGRTSEGIDTSPARARPARGGLVAASLLVAAVMSRPLRKVRRSTHPAAV